MRAASQPEKSSVPAMTAAVRTLFARHLRDWYADHARSLPWRGIRNPYRTWLSEIMLQQTRVNAVLEHYTRFLKRFPTLISLALATEDDVLAHWSGLGYYRRARMLHRTAKLLLEEHGGELPSTAAELQRLPGIGTYTSAAIASIAFDEPIAVVDGNVERVLLRVLGQPEASDAATKALLERTAQSLVPAEAPGDHNQAMMELGATVCLPRGPLCMQCPVFTECRTRGEHSTLPRAPMKSQRVLYGLTTRRSAAGLEILLQRRSAEASLMPGMLELPELLLEAEAGARVLMNEPILRVRHAITGTNYYVEVLGLTARPRAAKLAVRSSGLEWHAATSLLTLPLTGLARKVLQRLKLMKAPGNDVTPEVPLLIGRGGTVRVGNDA